MVDGLISELFEGRTVTLGCDNSTINQTLTVWYKNDEVINNTATRNLTLILKGTDTGSYKCGIKGVNSTNELNVTVKGMSRRVFWRDVYCNVIRVFAFQNNGK